MENEEVFEADAEINGLEQMRSRSSYRSTQKGHDTGEADLASERNTHDEETPLLSRDHEVEGRGASESSPGETRRTPKWDGEGDFEGRPWWNKPSVRNSQSDMNVYNLTGIYRFSGSFLPSSSSP